MSHDEEPKGDEPRLSAEEVAAATKTLEAIVENRAVMADLSKDVRERLMTAAGRASRPGKSEKSALGRARPARTSAKSSTTVERSGSKTRRSSIERAFVDSERTPSLRRLDARPSMGPMSPPLPGRSREASTATVAESLTRSSMPFMIRCAFHVGTSTSRSASRSQISPVESPSSPEPA